MKKHLFALTVVACSGSGSADSDVGPRRPTDVSYQLQALSLGEVCTETAGQLCRSCEAEQAAKRDLCWDTCGEVVLSGSVSCVDGCGRVGGSDYCDFYCDLPETDCFHYGLDFELTRQPDTELLAACARAVARDESCDEDQTGPLCEAYAKVERPEAVAYYECAATIPCGESTGPCVGVPEEMFGAVIQAQCPEKQLNEELREALDLLGDWLHPDVRDDAGICAELYCGNPHFQECLEAWHSAVLGY